MEHVRQTELIQLAANELMGARRAEVEQHLAACPECQARYAQQAATWGVLGEWTPDAPPVDLLARVERRLDEAVVSRHPMWARVWRVGRVAAAIAVGVGAGYGTARGWRPVEASTPAVVSAVDEQAALAALGLECLESPTPAGLYVTLQALTAPAGHEEGQP